jgi:hypothetical protein
VGRRRRNFTPADRPDRYTFPVLPEPIVERRDTDAPKGLPRQRRSLAVVFFGTTEQRVEAIAIASLILAGLGWWWHDYRGGQEAAAV